MTALAAPRSPAPAVAGVTDAELQVAAQALGTTGADGARLVSALLQPDLYGPELVARIAAEPGIAARVLRVANSAYFGCRGTVSTLERAVQVLGLAAVKGAAAAACMDRLVGQGAAAGGLDVEAFRRHSLATACAAARLARTVAPALTEEAYMAGLLHDLGLVLLWKLRPQAMIHWMGSLAARQVPQDTRLHAEQAVVGTPHEHASALLLRSWSLPDALVDAVARHHDSWAPGAPDLTQLLACADALAGPAGLGLVTEAIDARPWQATLDAWGLDAEARAALAQDLQDDVAALQAALRD